MTSAVVVDDSALMRQLISSTLEDGGVTVAETACDGSEAVAAVKRHNPDVVTMDVEMPNMDGLEAVDRIMAEVPTPTLMLSAYTEETANVSLEALDRGAVDVFLKPGGEVSTEISAHKDHLVEKVCNVANADVSPISACTHERPSQPSAVSLTQPRTIVIGASTGGPRIAKTVLSSLPLTDCRVVIVQHMPGAFTSRFADRLDEVSRYDVREADGRTQISRGSAVLAPGDHHLVVKDYRNGKLTLDLLDEHSTDELIVPSVNVTMRSAAAAIDDSLVGVLLSGMGADGVAGLEAIGRSGGIRIAQSETDCAVFGMPRRAIEQGHVDAVCEVQELPDAILSEERQ